jgi:hypothetical protein
MLCNLRCLEEKHRPLGSSLKTSKGCPQTGEASTDDDEINVLATREITSRSRPRSIIQPI